MTPEETPAQLDAPDEDQRRQLLALLATDRDAIRSLSEDIGEDVLPYVLQAIVIELAKLSVTVETEVAEKLALFDSSTQITGAAMAGLFDLGMSEPEPDDSEDRKMLRPACEGLFKRGTELRQAAGIAGWGK